MSMTQTVRASVGERRKRTPLVPQVGETDCGPACLVAVLAAFGSNVTLAAAAAACDVGRDGVGIGDIARAAGHFGLAPKALRVNATTSQAWSRVAFPAVALLTGGHFLVIDGVHGDRIRTNDPAAGRRDRPLAEFAAECTGILLTFSPGPHFAPVTSKPSPGPGREWWAGETRRVKVLVGVALLAGAAGVAASVWSATSVRNGLRTGTPDSALWWSVSALAVVAVIVGWTQKRLHSAVQLASSVRRSRDLTDSMLRLPGSFFQLRFTGELAGRPQRVDGAAMQMAEIGIGTGVQTLLFAGATAALAILTWPLALLVVLASVVGGLVARHGAQRDQDRQTRAVGVQAGRDGDIVSSLLAIETVKAEASGPALLTRWTTSQASTVALSDSGLRQTQRRGRLLAAWDGLVLVGILVAAERGGPVWSALPVSGLLGVVVFGALAQSAARAVLESSVFGMNQVRAALRAVEDVQTQPANGPATARIPGRTLTLQNIRFGFHHRRAPLLDDISLTVPVGTVTVVIGRTGAGKSTLAKLAAGALEPWSGAIDGGPVGYVPQRPVVLEGTVAENVRFGLAEASDSQIQMALVRAGLAHVVAARGGAENALVQQDGRNFSGGERQRLALARALLREPEILVLDEATSAVEEALEAELFDRLRELGTTVLAIAHRIPPLRAGDRLYRLSSAGLEEVTDFGGQR